MPVIYDEAESI